MKDMNQRQPLNYRLLTSDRQLANMSGLNIFVSAQNNLGQHNIRTNYKNQLKGAQLIRSIQSRKAFNKNTDRTWQGNTHNKKKKNQRTAKLANQILVSMEEFSKRLSNSW